MVVSAAALSVGAVVSRPIPWFFLGFEGAVLVAGVLAFLTAQGRFREGPALAMATFAGIVAVGSLLGYLGSGKSLLGHDLRPILLARLAIAALMALTSAWWVLRRRLGESSALLGRGLAFGVAAAAVGAGLWFGQGLTGNWNAVLRLVLGVVLSCVCLGLFAATVHCLIRAFEVGRLRDGTTSGTGAA